jgi:hypothetical protein
MQRKQKENSGLEVETGQFLGAAVLVGVGGLVAFTGFTVGCLHALSQSLRLVGRTENSPNEWARAKMNQAVAAAAAGANAWKGLARPDSQSATG